MKKKKMLMPGAIVLVIVLVIAAAGFVIMAPKWSEATFEAVVQETVTRSDGEIRLIVERTTEIYGNPLNSLSISDKTSLNGEDGEAVTVSELKAGMPVEVTLKNAFTEETPFYYPTVYKIKIIENTR